MAEYKCRKCGTKRTMSIDNDFVECSCCSEKAINIKELSRRTMVTLRGKEKDWQSGWKKRKRNKK